MESYVNRICWSFYWSTTKTKKDTHLHCRRRKGILPTFMKNKILIDMSLAHAAIFQSFLSTYNQPIYSKLRTTIQMHMTPLIFQ